MVQSPALSKKHLLLAFGLLLAALLWAINRPLGGTKTELQARYEDWLKSVDTHFVRSDNPAGLNPPLLLRLSANDPKLNINYQLSSSDFPDAASRVLRILNIVKESNLFTDNRWAESKKDSLLNLVVSRGDNSFRAQIKIITAQQDVKLQTMLKLFQVFALERDSLRASMLANNSNEIGMPLSAQN